MSGSRHQAATWRFVASSLMLLLLAAKSAQAAGSQVYLLHADSACASTPTLVGFQTLSSSCSASSECSSANADGLYWSQACATADYASVASSAFAGQSYFVMEIFDSIAETDACSTLLSGVAFLADGSCLATDNTLSSVRASLNDDGSASLETYRGMSCSGDIVKNSSVSSSALATHSCVDGALKFYSSDARSETTTATSTAAARLWSIGGLVSTVVGLALGFLHA